MTIITLNEAREAALAALAAEGDHIYQMPLKGQSTCTYSTPDGAPSCLVGHVFYRLDPDEFQGLFEMEWSGYVEEADSEGFEPNAFEATRLEGYTPMALRWLAVAQNRQDSEFPWSVAIKSADREVARDRYHRATFATEEEIAYIKGFTKEQA